jgi:chromate transporter
VNTSLRLVLVFSVLSLLGFGGGKGIIPQMHRDSVSEYHWVTNTQFTEFYTIGKLVPGPTTIFAALIGYTVGGVPMAAVATAAMFVPAALAMLLIGMIWTRLPQTKLKTAVTGGLAPVVVGLMWSAVLAVGKGVPLTVAAFGIIGVIAALSIWTKLGTPVLILTSGLAGLIILR